MEGGVRGEGPGGSWVTDSAVSGSDPYSHPGPDEAPPSWASVSPLRQVQQGQRTELSAGSNLGVHFSQDCPGFGPNSSASAEPLGPRQTGMMVVLEHVP